MESDIERQNLTHEMDNGHHDPGVENRGGFKKLGLFIFVALFLIGCLPVLAIVFESESLGISSKYTYISLPFLCFYLPMIGLSLPLGMFLRKNVSKGMAGIYNQSRSKELFSIIIGSWVFLARAGFLISWWLALNLLVPRFKTGLTLLGSPLWKWSLLAFTLPYAYFVALVVSGHLLLSLLILRRIRMPPQSMWLSASLVVYFGILLGAWLRYFATDAGLKHASTPRPEAFQYVTWTWVSLLVGSILWSFKVVFLLWWSDNAIYRRFEPRISITGVKFLYIGLIVGGFFEPQIIEEMELLEEYSRHQNQPESFKFTNYIVSKHTDTFYLRNVGHYLTSLAKFVRPLQEDGVPDFLKFLEDPKFHQTVQTCQPVDILKLLDCQALNDKRLRIRELLKRRRITEQFSPEEYRNNIAKVLHCIVREQCASKENPFTLDDLKKWMVDAHMNCVNMGRTLADATAIVTRLDIFISFLIFLAVVLLWLLITGFATTKVLVTIATPLLALTFVFGDSAKQFFQGIIFCFGTHAFDVGDRCILDDTELEVKNISILTTTFVKIGSDEKRTYPNSELATKAIVNLGWQPDPSDTVELTLDYSTTCTDWQMMESKIHQFFTDSGQEEFFKSSHEVMMKEIGDKIMVTIHFTHVLNIKEMTHRQCLLKKNRQRSIILKRINYFIDNKSASGNDNTTGLVNSQVVPRNDLDQPGNTSEIVEEL